LLVFLVFWRVLFRSFFFFFFGHDIKSLIGCTHYRVQRALEDASASAKKGKEDKESEIKTMR